MSQVFSYVKGAIDFNNKALEIILGCGYMWP